MASALIVGTTIIQGSPTASAATGSDLAAAMDIDPTQIVAVSTTGSDLASTVSTDPFGVFPGTGGSFAVLSTGIAADVLPGEPGNYISTELGAATGADGNDLSSLSVELRPPADATCLAFDFQFLSEEYPEYVGSPFNDIFTAELNETSFSLDGTQVISPNNFAYDSSGNFVSINTILGFEDAVGTSMDGTTPALVAVSPVERDIATGNVTLILTVQDIGDSILDSAVLIDSFRWLYGQDCDRSVSPLTDTDGDGLPDSWETEGIDYDGDGSAELDLPTLGADPMRADIFVEVDWMVRPETCLWFICWGGRSFKPQQAALDDVVQAFADAPYDNPDGTSGITLHVEVDEEVPYAKNAVSLAGSQIQWDSFESLKEEHFDPLRRDAFHYVVYSDMVNEGSGSSGLSRGIPGADFILADGHEEWGAGFTRIQERGTFMHELGHNLSLMHGGPDHTTYLEDPAYLSVMNYAYQLRGIGSSAALDYSRGAPHDDWANVVFNGGSIGDLGDGPPVLLTEVVEELTPDDAEAIPGDGNFVFEGPSVLALGQADQSLFATIVNPGGVETEYNLRIATSGGELLGEASVIVAGGGEALLRVPVDVASISSIGNLSLDLSLTSDALGQLVASATVEVAVVDLDDPAVSVEAARAVEELGGASHSMPAEVVAALEDLLADDATPSPSPSPSSSPSPSQSPSPAPTANPHTDLYSTPGHHSVNGREWFTTCEDYSQTQRCRTAIWGTTVTYKDGVFTQRLGWTFNNLTYLPVMKRSQWKQNPLGHDGEWISPDNRRWYTECDTPAVGGNGCRSYIWASLIKAGLDRGGNRTFEQTQGWVFNNMVRFR